MKGKETEMRMDIWNLHLHDDDDGGLGFDLIIYHNSSLDEFRSFDLFYYLNQLIRRKKKLIIFNFWVWFCFWFMSPSI